MPAGPGRHPHTHTNMPGGSVDLGECGLISKKIPSVCVCGGGIDPRQHACIYRGGATACQQAQADTPHPWQARHKKIRVGGGPPCQLHLVIGSQTWIWPDSSRRTIILMPPSTHLHE